MRLVSDGGVQTAAATVDLTSYRDDFSSDCNATADSPEAVFHITLTQARDVELMVAPEQLADGGPNSSNPVVYVRAGVCGVGPEPECRNNRGAGSSETILRLNVPSGDYYVFVEHEGPPSREQGPVVLTATLRPASTPAGNDTCLTPSPLFPLGGNQSQFSSTTGMSNDDYRSTCTSGGSADVVYEFSTTTTHKLTVQAQALGLAGLARPSLYLLARSECLSDGSLPSDRALGCANSTAVHEKDTLVVSNLAPGDYLLVVDGYTSSGDFQLTSRLDAVDPPASNEDCARAQLLSFTNGSVILDSTTRGAANHHSGVVCSSSASGSGSSDLAYQFLTPTATTADGGVNARVMVISRNEREYGPSVYLTDGCTGPELACSSLQSSATHMALTTGLGLRPSTNYWVWVDTSGSSRRAGPFTLQVDVAGAPPNDTCATPVALPLNTSVAGTTLGADPDYSSDALGGSVYTRPDGGAGRALPSGETVYTWRSAVAGPASIQVIPQRGFNPALVVASGCEPGTLLDTLDTGGAGEGELFRFDALANTTYTIFVDGVSSTSNPNRGGYIISVAR